MKLKVIAAFNDMAVADPDTRRREIGDGFEVEDGRAAQLVALRLVEEVKAAPPAPAPDEPTPAAPEPLHLTPEMAEPAAPPQPAPPVA